jgi:L-asparagine transporter-like permease
VGGYQCLSRGPSATFSDWWALCLSWPSFTIQLTAGTVGVSWSDQGSLRTGVESRSSGGATHGVRATAAAARHLDSSDLCSTALRPDLHNGASRGSQNQFWRYENQKLPASLRCLNECMHVSQVRVVISVIASVLLPVYLPLQVPSIRLRSIEARTNSVTCQFPSLLGSQAMESQVYWFAIVLMHVKFETNSYVGYCLVLVWANVLYSCTSSIQKQYSLKKPKCFKIEMKRVVYLSLYLFILVNILSIVRVDLPCWVCSIFLIYLIAI